MSPSLHMLTTPPVLCLHVLTCSFSFMFVVYYTTVFLRFRYNNVWVYKHDISAKTRPLCSTSSPDMIKLAPMPSSFVTLKSAIRLLVWSMWNCSCTWSAWRPTDACKRGSDCFLLRRLLLGFETIRNIQQATFDIVTGSSYSCSLSRLIIWRQNPSST
ncbi:hypothetical protein BD309DRAFT_27865 [Dichomitus squalens]|nr:hypothetical protein BD309DRAFT_27865 [Dichomitus squalens]